jgi:hypothetical protein
MVDNNNKAANIAQQDYEINILNKSIHDVTLTEGE